MSDIKENDPETVSFSLLLDKEHRDIIAGLVGRMPGMPPDTPATAAAVIRAVIRMWEDNWRELDTAREILSNHGQTLETKNLLKRLEERDMAMHFEQRGMSSQRDRSRSAVRDTGMDIDDGMER